MTLDAPRRRLITLLLALAAVVVAAILVLGGGEDSPEEAAQASAEEFVDVLADGDYESACGRLSESLATQLGGEECPDRLGATVGQAGEDLEIEVVDVRVSGPKAVAETRVQTSGGPTSESSFDMELEDYTWRVTRLGS